VLVWLAGLRLLGHPLYAEILGFMQRRRAAAEAS
jgi:hypothetical protein